MCFSLKGEGKNRSMWKKLVGARAKTNNNLNPRVLSRIQSRSPAHLLLFPYWICENRKPEN